MSSTVISSRRRFLQAGAAGLAVSSLPWTPARGADSQLVVRSADPFNAEPELGKLVHASLTPVQEFYVRNHGPTPKVMPGFKMHVEGMVGKAGAWSLEELKGRFAEASGEATLTCAGNRRMELSAIQPVSGVQWDAGAIGHARWTGVKLADVLKSAEIKPEAKHAWFEGLDAITEKDGSAAPFGGSIPLDKAMATDAPALLASAMNGEALTVEHGYPLRAVVPGYIGARSVKWLTKITLSDRPSPNHYVAEAYKIVTTDAKSENAAAAPIYEFPVNVAICTPAAGADLHGRRVTVGGYALPSGERGTTIEQVELSSDGGRTWKRAKLASEARPYTWSLWTAEVDLAPGKHELVARATDSRDHATPERGAWNLKGYMFNGWHRVTISVTA
jgi:sulfite oxidase